MENTAQNAGTRPVNERLDFTEETGIFEEGETEIERSRKELASEKDARLRLAAEYENYRRRTKKELAQAGEAGKRALLESIVALGDDLDLALANAGESSDAVAVGLRMIHRGFHAMLEANGVVAFESKGAKFDPERHEAFDMMTGAKEESGTVKKEIRRGYFWNNNLLRPAIVVVAQ